VPLGSSRHISGGTSHNARLDTGASASAGKRVQAGPLEGWARVVSWKGGAQRDLEGAEDLPGCGVWGGLLGLQSPLCTWSLL
jgi:hypothetical protein